MSCIDKNTLVKAVVARFWDEFDAALPSATEKKRRELMVARFDNRLVTQGTAVWYKDYDMYYATAEEKQNAERFTTTVKCYSHCDGDTVTFTNEITLKDVS